MSQSNKNNIDDVFKSMNNKLDISKQEQNAIFSEMNMKIKQQNQPTNKKKYKYYLAFSAAAILLYILTLPMINSFLTDSSEFSLTEILSIVKEDLQVGLTEKEIKEILGSAYSEVFSAKDERVVWRYDVETVTDYNFLAADDFADIEGIQNGEVKMQLFITWGEDYTVNSISALYRKETDGKIYNYRVYPDNITEESQLNFSND
jgi:hypothetical protein